MYKVKDDVIYKDIKCFIGKVLGDGRYMIITRDKYNMFEVYEKDLEPIDNNIPATCDRYEVRHVVYDTKDNKIVNDAMGECYITMTEAREVCDEMNAPKVMKPVFTKEVEYFGVKLMVPDNTKYLATNGIGAVHASNKELTISNINAHWCTTGTGNLSFITKVDLNGIDWKDTLMEIK